MGNLFASTGLGDEKPHERDVEYCGFAGRRPHERQNENPETPAVHTYPSRGSSAGARDGTRLITDDEILAQHITELTQQNDSSAER